MQQLLNVLEPAGTYDLISMEEVKTLLGISLSDVTREPQIEEMIEVVSGEIAKACNRVFGREKVTETFYGVDSTKRLFLSRWPVVYNDIESLIDDGVDIVNDDNWMLEESTGMLFLPSGYWDGDISVTYTGGYELPDDAPLSLKRAALMVSQETYYSLQRGDSTIRMISHKNARVMYFAPNQMGGTTSGPTQGAVEKLIARFRRDWV